MCQLSNKTEPVILLTEPMRVYKLVEMCRKTGDLESYYRRVRVVMGETCVKYNDFVADIERARNYKKYPWIPADKFDIEEQGFHSLVSLDDAYYLLRHGSPNHNDWVGIIAECEIPAKAHIIHGRFSDVASVKTVVSSYVKYVRKLK